MIRLRVMELLKAKNKTRYWLSKQLGMNYQNLDKMVYNQTNSIQFKNIELLCQLFECMPNDLFEMDSNLPEGHREDEIVRETKKNKKAF